MNPFEWFVREKYKKMGYSVHRNGFPDFFVFKENERGVLTEGFFIEAKGFGDTQRGEQVHFERLCKFLGLKYILEVPGDAFIEDLKTTKESLLLDTDFMIMDMLNDENPHTALEISDRANRARNTISERLNLLVGLGKVKKDRKGHSIYFSIQK